LLAGRARSEGYSRPELDNDRAVNVAVVDVGSNTVRLLVARREGSELVPLDEGREHLFLGEDVERDGRLSAARIDETAECVAGFVDSARGLNATVVEVIVTAPGRQGANGDELVRALLAAGGAPVRVLSADEEGELAFAGAVAAARLPQESVAVVDVGGGSTEVVVGTTAGGPAWSRSLELGAVRLTARFLEDDPPGKRALAAAKREVERHLDGFAPPLPQAALAAGGTARALRKLVGRELDDEGFDAALAILGKRSAAKTARTFGLHERRVRTLPAGAVILAALRERLGVSLQVSRAGLREGVALALLDEFAASAA
jgi:exopolyphosphatase / guanosine-5'-triphosphate,3'-diphosphate pyrophosphatase